MSLEILPLILVLAFVGYIFYGLFLLVYSSIRSSLDDLTIQFKNKVDGSLQSDYEIHLLGRFRFYDKLPEKLRIKFLVRVKNFVSNKSFESRGALEITDEMKTWVAASAVQLTFGLREYRFDYFWKIILYPESYYSKRGDTYYMGETNAKGIIVLSWKDLQRGFSIENDSFNVGLHEMAHALELEYRLREDYDIYFGTYFEKWLKMSQDEFEHVNEERESFLRNYAGTNRQEFFAVCVEYFFEESAEFKQRLPQVYYQLCMLLNQDPLASDTKLPQKIPVNPMLIAGELENLSPVYSTNYSVGNIGFRFAGFVFAVFLLSLQGFKSTPVTFYVSVGIFILILLNLFFSMNKFILFEKYLVIKSATGAIKKVFELDEIVYINFRNEKGGNLMQVNIARDGEIVQSNYSYVSSAGSIEEFKKKAEERNVLVK